MADLHDVIAFSSEGEKILGVVIEHYTNPLDDFYVVYADYTLYRVYNSDDDAHIILENVIIPACDEALTDFRLKRQHLKDMGNHHKELQALIDAVTAKMNGTESFFVDDTL